jgi:hypothetical protein
VFAKRASPVTHNKTALRPGRAAPAQRRMGRALPKHPARAGCPREGMFTNLSHAGAINALRASRAGNLQLSEAINGRRRSAPLRPDQIDAMHKALEQVRTRLRLTGPKALPVAELVAIRIVELARDGEFDPEKLTETVVAEFDGSGRA